MKKLFAVKDKHLFWKRTLICFAGVFRMGFFLSFLIMAGLGTDPCTFMNLSISSKLGLSLGNWQLMLNIILLILVILIDRRLIGLGTLFNMILIGYYADFFCWLWRKLLPETVFTEMPVKAIVYGITLIGFIVSAAVYMTSRSGISPYDGLAKIVADRLPLPFFLSRILYDFAAIGIGMLVGGVPSIGHILMAAGLGPVISIIGKKMAKIVGE